MTLVVVSAAFGAFPSFPPCVCDSFRRSIGCSRDQTVGGQRTGAFRMSLNNGLTEGSCLSDVHTEAVQAALAKHKERKMAVPMPSKRRSLVVQTSMDAYTPPGERPARCPLPGVTRGPRSRPARSAGPRLCGCGAAGALTPTPRAGGPACAPAAQLGGKTNVVAVSVPCAFESPHGDSSTRQPVTLGETLLNASRSRRGARASAAVTELGLLFCLDRSVHLPSSFAYTYAMTL